MNKRFLSVLVFALVVSAAASLILYQVISSRLLNDKASAMTRLLVASRKLEVGTLIKESDLTMADWGGPVPETVCRTARTLSDRLGWLDEPAAISGQRIDNVKIA